MEPSSKRRKRPIRIEITETVAHWHTVPVPINACQGREDVRGGVGNERRVMVGEERPLAFEEVQQVRHLLQVGGNVGIIANEVRVIELHVDYVFDASAW